MSSSSSPLSTPFLPTYTTFSRDNEQFLIQLTNLYLQMALAINAKIIGNYETFETPTGSYFFPVATTVRRQVFRKCFTFDDSSLIFDHGIANLASCTLIQGTAVTTVPSFIPIPYTNTTAANQIQVDVTSTQVIITRGGGAPTLVSGLLILEYLKSS